MDTLTLDTERLSTAVAQIDIRLPPRVYCSEVLKTLCLQLGYRFGSIILVNQLETGDLFASHNLPATYAEMVRNARKPILSSPSGEAIANQRVVTVTDIEGDPRLLPWVPLLRQLRIEAISWVPLISNGKAYGTYTLYDTRKRRPSIEEERVLLQLSNLFSLAVIANEYIDQLQDERKKLQHEISERKEAEKQLLAAKETAEAANNVKSQFLTNMSHELRTPMNAIIGFAELLRQEEDDPVKIESLNIIYESSERLLRLIKDILEFSDLESGQLELKESDFDVEDLMDELYRETVDQATRKGLKLYLTKNNETGRIMHADRYYLKQIVENLLDNALKFTAKGSVYFGVRVGDNHSIFTVTDTGIGIPEDQQKTIFKQFNKADMSSTREHGGLGIGLTIAAKLVKKMGGKITLQSRIGQGTSFTITLPL